MHNRSEVKKEKGRKKEERKKGKREASLPLFETRAAESGERLNENCTRASDGGPWI